METVTHQLILITLPRDNRRLFVITVLFVYAARRVGYSGFCRKIEHRYVTVRSTYIRPVEQ